LDSRARRWTVQLVAKEKVPRASLQALPELLEQNSWNCHEERRNLAKSILADLTPCQ